MRSDLRAVFDTNTLVSALLFDGSVPARAFFGALHQGEILLSRATFQELSPVLSRTKFDRYVTQEERTEFLERLLDEGTVMEITVTIQACRGPKDDKCLELAVSANAASLVTGDQDLLALNPFRGNSILTPAQFLATFVENSGG
jgi:putative PIN family toxin of toxin-antitoxin system